MTIQLWVVEAKNPLKLLQLPVHVPVLTKNQPNQTLHAAMQVESYFQLRECL